MTLSNILPWQCTYRNCCGTDDQAERFPHLALCNTQTPDSQSDSPPSPSIFLARTDPYPLPAGPSRQWGALPSCCVRSVGCSPYRIVRARMHLHICKVIVLRGQNQNGPHPQGSGPFTNEPSACNRLDSCRGVTPSTPPSRAHRAVGLSLLQARAYCEGMVMGVGC